MISWSDSHNHLQDPRLGGTEHLVSEMRNAGIRRSVVNATCESDWASVESLALDHPDLIRPAFGIHPWKAHTVNAGWVGRLEKMLEKHPLASIGECGLDQWVASPPLDIQRSVFAMQIKIACEMRRPITIHCLKAWGALLDVFSENDPPPKFLLHSYGGSIEMARRLIPLGARFSFSGHFLHPRKAAVVEVFRQLPMDRILLETDAPDMLPPEESIRHPMKNGCNHPANLPLIGQALAAQLGMSGETLAGITSANWDAMFD